MAPLTSVSLATSVSRQVERYSRRTDQRAGRTAGLLSLSSESTGRPLMASMRIGTMGTICTTGWPCRRVMSATPPIWSA